MVCKRVLHKEDDCALLAQDLARIYKASMLEKPSSWKVYLHGDLGVGKTSFVRYLLRALGLNERVKSPSFAIMHSYSLVMDDQHPDLLGSAYRKKGNEPSLSFDAYHFDFYRLNTPGDWLGAGLEDHFDEPCALLLVEWPEKASLPAADIRIHWSWGGEEGNREADSCQDEHLQAELSPRHVTVTARPDFWAFKALKLGLQDKPTDPLKG